MLESLKLIVDSLGSNYRPRRSRPRPEFTERWESIFRRFPTLNADETTMDWRIIHRGQVLPFSTFYLSRHAELGSHLAIGTVGPPKSLKTSVSVEMLDILRRQHISFVLNPEPMRHTLPLLENRDDLNVIRALLSLVSLETRESAYRHGGDIPYGYRLHFYEQGVDHSLLFAWMQRFVTGRPSRFIEVFRLAKQALPKMDIEFAFWARPDVSSARGAKMPMQNLIGYTDAMLHFPDLLARATRDSGKPHILINLYTNDVTDKRGIRGLAGRMVRSIGEIAQTMKLVD